MNPGELVRIVEMHFGLGYNAKSYVLYPGDDGLVVENDNATEILTLLISGELMEVEERAVEILR